MEMGLFRGNRLLYVVFFIWFGTLLRVSQSEVYTNDWAIRIRADEEAVNRIAEKHGFANQGQVGDRSQRGGHYPVTG